MSGPATDPAEPLGPDLRARLRDRLMALCRIPSPSLEEREVVSVLRRELEELGAAVHEDDAGRELGGMSGNLVAELAGAGPRIMLEAHVDTVPLVPGEPLAPVVDGDLVRSGGRQILGADDKAGVAIVMELVRAVARLGRAIRPTVLAVFTVAEERGLRGAQALDVASLRADMGYVFDGEVPVGEVIAAAVAKASLTLTVRGRRAHAALEPQRGVHAIAAAAAVVGTFPLGHQQGGAVANLGRIEGGGASNVVPDLVTIEGEARAFEDTRLAALLDQVRDGAEVAAAAHGASATLEQRRLYDAYDLSEDAEPFRRLRAAAAGHGIDVRKVRSIGGSDTNVFNGRGVPTVNVGIGMHEIHSVDEWIDVRDLERVVRWVFDALRVR